MSGQMSIFDFMDESEKSMFMPRESTDWRWKFDDYPKEKNGLTVFSCFACGGGSTMGYKLAGCDVIGCVEIDPAMNEIYKAGVGFVTRCSKGLENLRLWSSLQKGAKNDGET